VLLKLLLTMSALLLMAVAALGAVAPSEAALSAHSPSLLATNSSSGATSRELSRQRRFFAPLPDGAAFVLTPKFAIPFPAMAPGGATAINIDVPLTFTFPTPSPEGEGSGSNYESGSYYRRLDQQQADLYAAAEGVMTQLGLDGRGCVLRAVCEAAEAPLHEDGLLGEIINGVLRATVAPAGSGGEGTNEYRKAAERGRAVGRCDEYYSVCPVSVFTMV